MTEEELTRLESLEKAATPGPWTAHFNRTGGDGVSFGKVCAHVPPSSFAGAKSLIIATGFIDDYWSPKWGPLPSQLSVDQNANNAEFLAAARNALPELIADIRRLRAERQTGIGRATWSTGDEAQYQTGSFTITETNGASQG